MIYINLLFDSKGFFPIMRHYFGNTVRTHSRGAVYQLACVHRQALLANVVSMHDITLARDHIE